MTINPGEAESKSVYEEVKQFFDRHKDFKTYGDAISWLHKTDPEQVRQESGLIGRSVFSIDILWLTSTFGPSAKIDLDMLKPSKSKPTPDYIPPEKEVSVAKVERTKRRKPKAKVAALTNALGVPVEQLHEISADVAEDGAEQESLPTDEDAILAAMSRDIERKK